MHAVMVGCVAALALAAAGSAVAQESAGTDPRALAACQTEARSFVDIERCLPEAHVAVKVLDAFDATYPDDALPIKTKCVELNTTVLGAKICLVEAIKAAISLSRNLPEGSNIEDPVFNAAKDESLFAALEAAEADAKSLFPDRMMWGGGMYQPYR